MSKPLLSDSLVRDIQSLRSDIDDLKRQSSRSYTPTSSTSGTVTLADIAALDARLDVLEAATPGTGGSTGGTTAAGFSYVPTFSAATTQPVLGNGILEGRYYRIGDLITAYVTLTPGTTTTFGSGDLRLGLPIARAQTLSVIGSFLIVMNSGVRYTGISQIQPGISNYVRLVRDTTGVINATSPATFGTNDVFRFSLAYEL